MCYLTPFHSLMALQMTSPQTQPCTIVQVISKEVVDKWQSQPRMIKPYWRRLVADQSMWGSPLLWPFVWMMQKSTNCYYYPAHCSSSPLEWPLSALLINLIRKMFLVPLEISIRQTKTLRGELTLYIFFHSLFVTQSSIMQHSKYSFPSQCVNALLRNDYLFPPPSPGPMLHMSFIIIQYYLWRANYSFLQ